MSTSESVLRMPTTNYDFAVVVPVGPGEREEGRLDVLLESLAFHEPGRFFAVIVDDDPRGRPLIEAVRRRLGSRFVVVQNPRRGRGSGWSSGCTAGVLTGFHEILAHAESVKFALKLDTDALVIRPFADKVARYFTAHPGVGMLGAVDVDDGSEFYRGNQSGLKRLVNKLAKRLTVWRGTKTTSLPVLQIAYWGRYKRIRDTIRLATRNGFEVGQHCLGGSYAVSWPALESLAGSGFTADPLLWLPTPLVEDVTVTLCIQSAGYAFHALCRDDEPFAIAYKGLPDSARNLWSRGFSIIHSVKDHQDSVRESEVRDFFQKTRRQLNLSPTDRSSGASA